MHSAIEILKNVVWLINALDDQALGEVQDLPFLEMAKDVTITPASSRVCFLLKDCQEDGSLSSHKNNLKTNRLYIPGDEDGQDDEESSLPTCP